MSEALIQQKRSEFHAGLIASGTLTLDERGIASISDRANRLSVAVAADVCQALQVETANERAAGQTLGSGFESAVGAFVAQTFPAFSMLRPGQFEVETIGNVRRSAIGRYEPYTHLADLAAAIEQNPTLTTALGNAYAISPDIIVKRSPEDDAFINQSALLVDGASALGTPIRRSNQDIPILHAVISCKWTLRSDRAQNARSEALNLIRNRKGRLPHIVVVSAEPTPSRLSSLALGTGDIDCVYHIALPELVAAMGRHGNDDNIEALQVMIEGKRLKDISDLPLDLCI